MTGAAFPARVRHAVAVAPVEYAFTVEPSWGRPLAGPDTPAPSGRHLPAVPDTPLVADPCRPAERPWAGVADILLCRCGHATPSPREAGCALLRAYPGCLVAGVHGQDGRGVLVSPRGLVLVTPGASIGRAERWGTVAAAVLVHAWLVSGRHLAALPDTVLRPARNPSVPSGADSVGDGGGDGGPVPGRAPVHEVYVRAAPR
ncbi:hypothetical protein [Nocardiopsis synnemataformans]|uniref:hypothetical protein n=1 Tax=Nocardiopsis synnemataformans TaxID=61305 RepID=UPI003EC0BF1B